MLLAQVHTSTLSRYAKLEIQYSRSVTKTKYMQGILYFIGHRSLWSPLMSNLTPTLSLGLGITAFMFLVTYVPQMAAMALVEGPFAAISAAGLVLSESSTLTNIGARAWWVEGALVDTFDGVGSQESTCI